MKGLVNHFADESQDTQLAEHPIQFQIIEDIIMQCDFFCRIAEDEIDKKSQFSEKQKMIVKVYTKLKTDFESILKLKTERSLPHVDKTFRDDFHENLKLAFVEISNPPENH